MLHLVTTADTEILACARAVERLRRAEPDFPTVRCFNPGPTGQGEEASVEELVDAIARDARVVVCRVLGGRRGWQAGFDLLRERCRQQGIALVALGGEAQPDAEMTALSLAPAGAVATCGEYLRHPDPRNLEHLLRFLADTFLLTGYGFEPPRAIPDTGLWLPATGAVEDVEEAFARLDSSRPTIAVCFYRSHLLAGNTAFVEELARAIEEAGANAIGVWSYTLRPGPDGRVEAFELLRDSEGRVRVDALITTMLATGGSSQGDARAGAAGSAARVASGAGAASEAATGSPAADTWLDWDERPLRELGVPVIQAVCCTWPRARWLASETGLGPLDAATQVAIPEFDGRIIAGVISFKEREQGGSPVGAPLARYVPDRERCRRVARLAVRHARLRHTPAGERRVAIVLTSFPSRRARLGMAVGLDTARSALRLLDALAADGMRVERPFEDGDELMAALRAAGAPDEDLGEAVGDGGLRMAVDDYLAWYRTLPEELRRAVEERWGPPPGERYVRDGAFHVPAIELGNVLVMVQPPRGWGDDPVAIYHDASLPPSHHYLACYRFLDHHWRADACVQLGKHGTLEWLPGKTIALSPACAPDAAIGDLPFLYPFIVNDPGEGIQAKRRAHAVIIDHLVPPLGRAGTYDELAELENLLDEYARLEVLDPDKLPALAARIWEAVEKANLQQEIGVDEQPEDLGQLVEHIDGYLCEVKDIQIHEGFHVLGEAPAGEALCKLVAALMQVPQAGLPGLREAVGAFFGVDERALVERPGRRLAAGEAPAALLKRFPGPASSAGDLIDRLEEAQHALLAALDERDWAPEAVSATLDNLIGEPARDGRARAELELVLRFACSEVVPRLRATSDELDNLLAALRGRHVPSGPSGSPTRGRLDVLPTGRNFYGIDPRAIPSKLAFDVGQRLADALLERHRRDHGDWPRMVGLVAWGTSAMRTQGDDIAEAMWLIGVRPRWARESRRVTGFEIVPLEELGRPRIDVTLRISGFFRDAFGPLVELLDRAIAAVAALDEPDERNFVAAHARADARRLAAELGRDEAWLRATTRIFGSKPGAYGAGLEQLVDARDWRDDADLAEVYAAWGGYAYGRGRYGVEARDAMRDCYARIEAAVKNLDTREHDILDSADYFQYHGGMVAMVRALTGRDPAAYIGDAADPRSAKARTLAEETRRIFRARVANPRWIAAMVRHGHRGAAELAATVDYLFGYDATAGVADDWMYERIAERYLLDPDIARFMERSNPHAARAIAERLLEAAERGLWGEPDAELLERIRERALELEGDLEGAET
ncbi:cobaltochelatase subunit CobN [Thermoleophilum album]|uniref:cobaltochelatase subunit CobN n=1 Tax=Thermoleophilum album TaxID=29539 RepID=UPI00237C6620|nr:cobaltochelatase subunit CobN [Thermoleophilum album]WDT93149.1 cobaltochelatase subunit CobN [Thermoleophilum album]